MVEGPLKLPPLVLEEAGVGVGEVCWRMEGDEGEAEDERVYGGGVAGGEEGKEEERSASFRSGVGIVEDRVVGVEEGEECVSVGESSCEDVFESMAVVVDVVVELVGGIAAGELVLELEEARTVL